MAVQIPSFSKKNLVSPQFSIRCSRRQSSGEEGQHRSIQSYKAEPFSPSETHDPRNLDLHLMNRNSSATPSIDVHPEISNALRRANPQDQCFSSESVDDIRMKNFEGITTNPVFSMNKQDSAAFPFQSDYNLPIACPPINHGDSYFQGLATGYGGIPMVMGMTAPRIPLPVADDAPVFVNVKQYHGILRRRQSRARLEAQNKLVKNRKPYLHESRHLHAVNRQRGSGGRFLSTKNVQKPTASSSNDQYGATDFFQAHQSNCGLSR